VKNIGRYDPQEYRRILDKHVMLTNELIERFPEVALVAWPESVVQTGVLFDRRAGKWLDEGRWLSLSEAARLMGRPLLAGVLVGEVDMSKGFDVLDQTNSALLFDANGAVRARYDKTRLVQFTERMPFEPWIPVKRIVAWFLKVPKVYEFRAGRDPVLFDVAGRTFGVCICNENYYPDIWRKIAGKGATAIVNISNEAWFRESAELDLMYAMSKFRAVENRIGVVRATNSGISAVYDSAGRTVRVLEGPGGARRSVEGTLAVAVPAGRGGTVYGRIGDAVAWMAAGAVLAGLAWSAFFAKR
jgi:apolipoprotein N-acyltransferase